jgi:hypothetical protein
MTHKHDKSTSDYQSSTNTSKQVFSVFCSCINLLHKQANRCSQYSCSCMHSSIGQAVGDAFAARWISARL